MATDGLTIVRERMAAAAARAGRSLDDIRLVIVSKGRGLEAIQALHERGERLFGENRAQELAVKAGELPDDIQWHFVGPVQRRKVKVIRPFTSLLHSLDRIALAASWAGGPLPVPPSLLEVNIGAEPQKHGVLPEHLDETLTTMRDLGVEPRGLMIIPPVPITAEDSRRWFAQLRHLRDELVPKHPKLRELSMGMTDDFEVAIEEGASMIRVGRAIFEPAE